VVITELTALEASQLAKWLSCPLLITPGPYLSISLVDSESQSEPWLQGSLRNVNFSFPVTTGGTPGIWTGDRALHIVYTKGSCKCLLCSKWNNLIKGSWPCPGYKEEIRCFAVNKDISAGIVRKMIFSIKVFVTLLDYIKIPQVAILGGLNV
jgi:hypothetical protein